MRALFLLLAGGAIALAQPFAAGIKGGVPLNDLISAGQNQQFSFNANTSRYIFGGQAELRLPFGLGVEFDVLYRHFNYTGNGLLSGITASTSTTGNSWEFPLLAKYRFHGSLARPFVDAGATWDTLQGVSTSVQSAVKSVTAPNLQNKSTVGGFVIGGGLDIHAIVLHITPELRYTRWGAKHFLDPNGGLSSSQNQAEFLVGITF